MNRHATPPEAPIVPRRHRRPRGGVLQTVVELAMERFLLLPIGAVLALIWANTAEESYFKFAHASAFWVNEVAMAFFLALIGQEVVEAVMPGGALHTWRRWGMPLAAAAGGVAGAALAYLGWITWRYEDVLTQAWPIACAIDIAAGYFVAKTVWPRGAVLPFLLLVGIATDLFGVLALALWPASAETRAGGAALMIAALGGAALMRRWHVRSFWPYLVICGALSWWAFYLEGIHPALALLPIVPFLPHEPRRTNLFAQADDDAVHHFEHEWNTLVQAVLFLFGLVNAGVALRGYDTGTWAVLAAALIGRPLGILAAVWLAVSVGLHLPHRVGWRELIVAAIATSSGFTFALLLATGMIPSGPILAQIKLGALATVLGAPLALAAARLLRVGRFSR
jgi:NhaA family Na+:H+ antiporter